MLYSSVHPTHPQTKLASYQTYGDRSPWPDFALPRGILPYIQGSLYVLAGLWALLTDHRQTTLPVESFNLGCMQVMGLALSIAGGLMLAGAVLGVRTRSLAMLGAISAGVALTASVILVITQLAAPTYLLRASVDVVLGILWLEYLRTEAR